VARVPPVIFFLLPSAFRSPSSNTVISLAMSIASHTPDAIRPFLLPGGEGRGEDTVFPSRSPFERLIITIHDKAEDEGLDPDFRDEIEQRVKEIDSGKEKGVDAFRALRKM
jgi:hypothetical protein